MEKNENLFTKKNFKLFAIIIACGWACYFIMYALAPKYGILPGEPSMADRLSSSKILLLLEAMSVLFVITFFGNYGIKQLKKIDY